MAWHELGVVSTAQQQGAQAGEHRGQLVSPPPGALQAQDQAADVADDAGGDM